MILWVVLGAIHFGLVFLDYLFGLLRDRQRPRGIVISKASRYPASRDTTLSLFRLPVAALITRGRQTSVHLTFLQREQLCPLSF